MEARDVTIYFVPNNKNKIGGRFYNIYLNKEEKLDLALFLNNVADLDEFDKNVKEKYDRFKIIGGINLKKDGNVKEYDVILTFNNPKNNKDYVIYTDNLYDKDNKLKVFAAIYDVDFPEPFIGYPTSNQEWKDICELLDSVILESKGE